MTIIEARPTRPPALLPGGSLEADHQALRSNAAILDLSDVGFVHVGGAAATAEVQALFTRDIEFLTPERSITGLLLDSDGRPVDVVSCFMDADGDGVVLRTGFGAGPTVVAHVRANVADNVSVTELDVSALGIEGPYAWSAIGEVLDPDLASLPFEAVLPITWEDHELVFSRTGVTGEYGYQLSGSHEAIAALRERFGASAEPVGRGVVELAMLEVRQPLLARELVDGAGVIEAGLQWLVDITKPAFLGREALLASLDEATSATIGGQLDDPGGLDDAGSSADLLDGAEVVVGDEVIGHVVWAAQSPSRGATVALSRVRPELAASGLALAVRLADGRVLPYTTLSSPYVIPASWSVPIL